MYISRVHIKTCKQLQALHALTGPTTTGIFSIDNHTQALHKVLVTGPAHSQALSQALCPYSEALHKAARYSGSTRLKNVTRLSALPQILKRAGIARKSITVSIFSIGMWTVMSSAKAPGYAQKGCSLTPLLSRLCGRGGLGAEDAADHTSFSSQSQMLWQVRRRWRQLCHVEGTLYKVWKNLSQRSALSDCVILDKSLSFLSNNFSVFEMSIIGVLLVC